MNNKIPVFDGHNDTLFEFYKTNPHDVRNFAKEQLFLDIDLPRAKQGGFQGGLFSIFTPPPPESPESDPNWGLTVTDQGYSMTMSSPINPKYSQQFTDKLLAFIYWLHEELNNEMTIIHSYKNLEENWGKKMAVVLHFEDAVPINKDLRNLEYYYEKGIRSIGIVWSRLNVFGCGVPFAFPGHPNTGDGLTSAGKNLVRACNKLGIMIDLAHMNEKGFWDVSRTSNKPLVVTHAGVHKLCNSTRNVTDEQIDAVGKSDGLIGVIFEPINTRADGKPIEDTPLKTFTDHMLYVAERIGIDHVALGSDFDGCQTPKDLKNVSQLQNMIQVLRDTKLSEDEIEKIAYRNWMRILKDTWLN